MRIFVPYVNFGMLWIQVRAAWCIWLKQPMMLTTKDIERLHDMYETVTAPGAMFSAKGVESLELIVDFIGACRQARMKEKLGQLPTRAELEEFPYREPALDPRFDGLHAFLLLPDTHYPDAWRPKVTDISDKIEAEYDDEGL